MSLNINGCNIDVDFFLVSTSLKYQYLLVYGFFSAVSKLGVIIRYRMGWFFLLKMETPSAGNERGKEDNFTEKENVSDNRGDG